jgi:hypothetical protein
VGNSCWANLEGFAHELVLCVNLELFLTKKGMEDKEDVLLRSSSMTRIRTNTQKWVDDG